MVYPYLYPAFYIKKEDLKSKIELSSTDWQFHANRTVKFNGTIIFFMWKILIKIFLRAHWKQALWSSCELLRRKDSIDSNFKPFLNIPQTFSEHSLNYPWIFPEHFMNIPPTFPEYSPNIPWIFKEQSQKILWTFSEHSLFTEHSLNIPVTFLKLSQNLLRTFPSWTMCNVHQCDSQNDKWTSRAAPSQLKILILYYHSSEAT